MVCRDLLLVTFFYINRNGAVCSRCSKKNIYGLVLAISLTRTCFLNYPSSLAGLAGKRGCRFAGGEDERSCTATSRCGSRLDNVSPLPQGKFYAAAMTHNVRSPANSDKHFAANMIAESPIPTEQAHEETTSSINFTGPFICSLIYFEKFLYIRLQVKKLHRSLFYVL